MSKELRRILLGVIFVIVISIMIVWIIGVERKLISQDKYVKNLETHIVEMTSNEEKRADFINRCIDLSYTYNGKMRLLERKHLAECVWKYSQEYRVDPELVARMIAVESGFNRKAKSWYGAKGLLQITDGTFDYMVIKYKMGKRNVWNVYDNIEVGIIYIAHLRDLYGDMDKALGFYNAGRHWKEYYKKYIGRIEKIKF